MRALFTASLAIGLAGCVASPPPTAVSSAFNPAEVAWASGNGPNTIHGSAVLRTVGGDAKTCAGLPAYLTPVSTYANERMGKMFGYGVQHGMLKQDSGFTFAATDPAYLASARTTACDGQGNFSFTHIPDGDYYLTAFVTWGVPSQYFTIHEGGVLMQRVTVHGGETKDIVLTG